MSHFGNSAIIWSYDISVYLFRHYVVDYFFLPYTLTVEPVYEPVLAE
jgi:hypothetical protein